MAFLMLITAPVSEAADVATVMGKVKGRNNKPLSRVVVKIGDKTSFTDVKGSYRIKGVPFGNYTVNIKRAGKVLEKKEAQIDKPRIKLNVDLR